MGIIGKVSKDIPVKRKLVLLILATCIPSVLVCLVSLSFLNVNYVKKNLQANIQLISDLTVDHLSAPLAFNDQKRTHRILLSLKKNSAIKEACAYDKFDKLVASYTQQTSEIKKCTNNLNTEEDLLIVKSNITQKNERIGYLKIIANYEQITTLIKYHVLIIMFCSILVILFISLPLATYLQREISKPVYEILETTQNLFLPESNSRKLTKTADELLLSLLFLRKAESTLKLHQYNLKKVDSVISNREILINALEEKASSNYKVREMIKGVWENDPYQNLDQLYTYSTAISSDLDTELKDLVNLFRILHEKEKEILQNGKVEFSANALITDLLSSFTIKNSVHHVKMTYISSEELENIKLFKSAFYNCVHGVLKLLLSTTDKNQHYELVIKYSENKKAELFFSLENKDVNSNSRFDLNHVEIDELLIETKYFANINNPKKDVLQITLEEDKMTVKVVWCQTNAN